MRSGKRTLPRNINDKQEVKMFLIRHDNVLRIFGKDGEWTDSVDKVRTYVTEIAALSDINMHGLTDCSVVPVKVWVADLFAAGQIEFR